MINKIFNTLLRSLGAYLFLGACYFIIFPSGNPVEWDKLHLEHLLGKFLAIIFSLYIGLMFLRAVIENKPVSLKKPLRKIEITNWSE